MSLGNNTVTITVDTQSKVLTRINQTNFASQYYLREASQEFVLNVRHSKENPQSDGTQFDRHNVELIRNVFPTLTAPGMSHTAYMIIRNTRRDDYAKVEADTSGLVDFLDKATIDQLLAWVN